MNVREIMQSPARTVRPEANVTETARAILDCGLPGVPVMDEAGKPIGVVTQRDLVAKHARVHLPLYLGILGFVLPLETHRTEENLQRILGVTARDLMEERFIRIGADSDVDDAATLMVDEKADLLLVMEGERLLGVLTDADVIRLLVIEETDADQAPA